MSKFTKILKVSPYADGKTWVIREEFSYDVGYLGSNNTISVPSGFATDFASVPQVMWWFIAPWGLHGNGAVIHDYLYWMQQRSKKESDLIFLEAMGVLGVNVIKKYIIYYAVKLFGIFAWKSNTNNKSKGVNKIHTQLPEKATCMPDEN